LSNEPKDNKGIPWSEEKTSIVVDGLLKAADRYLSLREKEGEHETKYVEATSKHDRRVITVLLIFLGILMSGLFLLTWVEKISGESLMFAVGLTIGFVFALIHRFIFGSQRTPAEESES